MIIGIENIMHSLYGILKYLRKDRKRLTHSYPPHRQIYRHQAMLVLLRYFLHICYMHFGKQSLLIKFFDKRNECPLYYTYSLQATGPIVGCSQDQMPYLGLLYYTSGQVDIFRHCRICQINNFLFLLNVFRFCPILCPVSK